jgi:hypothetical protein
MLREKLAGTKDPKVRRAPQRPPACPPAHPPARPPARPPAGCRAGACAERRVTVIVCAGDDQGVRGGALAAHALLQAGPRAARPHRSPPYPPARPPVHSPARRRRRHSFRRSHDHSHARRVPHRVACIALPRLSARRGRQASRGRSSTTASSSSSSGGCWSRSPPPPLRPSPAPLPARRLTGQHVQARVEGAPVDKQLALLERVFPYISVPELRELPLALLAGLPRVPASYLLTLAQSPALVGELPVSVRRQV